MEVFKHRGARHLRPTGRCRWAATLGCQKHFRSCSGTQRPACCSTPPPVAPACRPETSNRPAQPPHQYGTPEELEASAGVNLARRLPTPPPEKGAVHEPRSSPVRRGSFFQPALRNRAIAAMLVCSDSGSASTTPSCCSSTPGSARLQSGFTCPASSNLAPSYGLQTLACSNRFQSPGRPARSRPRARRSHLVEAAAVLNR